MQQRPSASISSPTRSSGATPAPLRSAAPPAPRTPPAALQGSRSARVKADLDSERLLDRALSATHRRLVSSGVADRAILLVQRREAAHLFGKQLLMQLRPLLPATDRTAAARTAFAGWVLSLYKQHPDKKIGIRTLVAAHRRELWLLTRALMRLLEREIGAADVDEVAVDQEVDEDLRQEDEDLPEGDEEPEEDDGDLQEEDEDLEQDEED